MWRRGGSGGDSPFVSTPVAADAEMVVDRIRGIALVTAALSCSRVNKQRGKRGWWGGLFTCSSLICHPVGDPPTTTTPLSPPHRSLQRQSKSPPLQGREPTPPSEGNKNQQQGDKNVFICSQPDDSDGSIPI